MLGRTSCTGKVTEFRRLPPAVRQLPRDANSICLATALDSPLRHAASLGNIRQTLPCRSVVCSLVSMRSILPGGRARSSGLTVWTWAIVSSTTLLRAVEACKEVRRMLDSLQCLPPLSTGLLHEDQREPYRSRERRGTSRSSRVRSRGQGPAASSLSTMNAGCATCLVRVRAVA